MYIYIYPVTFINKLNEVLSFQNSENVDIVYVCFMNNFFCFFIFYFFLQ